MAQGLHVNITYINETGQITIPFFMNISSYTPCRRAIETKEFYGITCVFTPTCPLDDPQYGHLKMECKYPIGTNVSDIKPNLPIDAIDECRDDVNKLETTKASIQSAMDTERAVIVAVSALLAVAYLFKERIKNKLILRWWGK